MRLLFYPRLALDGIRKNKRMYCPYLLTCMGMTMMYYIIAFLCRSETVSAVRGGNVVQEFLWLGSGIIAFFSGCFLFYTNSFLIRRRKKEFGLYNILGMGKRNIGILLFWESLFIAVCALSSGLAAGMLCSKLAELGLIRMLSGEIDYRLAVSAEAIGATGKVFGMIFTLLFMNTLIQLKATSAISLLRSENVGEKPPRTNWLLGIAGAVILSGGYYTALTADDAFNAILHFFAAVILVIAGTYLVMIAGSVVFCRVLQRNRNYYYKAGHFVSVSSMVYRMKRNGAGLASICILATMVLVMLSSTASLYFGSEDSLKRSYPRELNLTFYMRDFEGLDAEKFTLFREDVRGAVRQYGTEPANAIDFRSISMMGYLDGGVLYTDPERIDEWAMGHVEGYAGVCIVNLIPVEDYNALMGESESLEEDEVLIYTDETGFEPDILSFQNGAAYRVKRITDQFVYAGHFDMSVVSMLTVFVPDLETAAEKTGILDNGEDWPEFQWVYGFDTGLSEDAQIELCDRLKDIFWSEERLDQYGYDSSIAGRAMNRADYYSLNGGLFYLGILLSIVFVFATVLIIYYKQISEGYEDQKRFEIMQKVGMTRREIRKSINSQLLTVFFLPLAGAGLHLAFAFPIICQLLLVFQLNNVRLFAVTTVIGFLLFAVFYTLVYRITSNAYYRIVSGK